jgi:DNA polymerase-3 subunit delta'
VESFETLPEQDEAKRLLSAALADGPAHAYLFHGPAGSGKRRAALLFAAALLGERDRVLRRTHPDLYVLEPLGDQIRIDPIRELRRDLHMRPFEADRRVYVIAGAHLMNEDAADALLKDLEEPPPYAVVVLVADELGPLPETIRSRCQAVPFRRLSQRAIKAHLAARGLTGERLEVSSRVAAGRLDRAERLLDDEAAESRAAVIELARSAYREETFDPTAAARRIEELAQRRGRRARTTIEEAALEGENPREVEQRAKRAERGAELDEIMEALDTLAAWYRDLVVVAAGAPAAVQNVDRLAELEGEADSTLGPAAEKAAEAVRQVWRSFEFNVQPGLALEALFVRLRRDLRALGAVPA